MKTWEKWWLRGAVMVVVMVLLSASPVFAKSNQVDKEGETYQGKMTLVTNTNFDISNDEAFKAALSTGETAKLSSFPEASPLTDQMAMQQCGTLAIDQGNVDLGEVRTTAEATPAVTYKVGDKKELSMIVGINADQSEQFEKITHTCLATGEHCTVWYADTTQTEAAQNLAAKFDGYYAKMVNGFGSPEAADVDHDGKVAVVVTSMDSIIAGYFWDEDLTREGEQMDRVNINQRIAYTAYQECTLCHEFQHLINFAQVGKNRDSWLNEVFSQSAPVVAGVDYEETTTMSNLMLTAYIKKYQQTIPFIFKGDYVPLTGNEAVIVYAEWFLFSRYLSAQTQGYSGGGDTIYKTILNYDTGDGEHACTREVLTNVLKEKGVISTSGN
ncbi:MAG: hypothetical protein PHI94_06370, partial [Eubacteriaceae bacterium]|nr:hypothetical protein [Eubacteriaceae bacterium]